MQVTSSADAASTHEGYAQGISHGRRGSNRLSAFPGAGMGVTAMMPYEACFQHAMPVGDVAVYDDSALAASRLCEPLSPMALLCTRLSHVSCCGTTLQKRDANQGQVQAAEDKGPLGCHEGCAPFAAHV